jgi:hypothetical protein
VKPGNFIHPHNKRVTGRSAKAKKATIDTGKYQEEHQKDSGMKNALKGLKKWHS